MSGLFSERDHYLRSQKVSGLGILSEALREEEQGEDRFDAPSGSLSMSSRAEKISGC